MRLSQIITRFRDEAQDTATSGSSQRWTDEKVTRFANRCISLMFAEQCRRDDSYHNFRLLIDSADAIQTESDSWDYVLPNWVYRVSAMREELVSGSPSTYGPAFPVSRLGTENGWKWIGRNRLQLNGRTTAPTIELGVCKVPAKLHQGACFVAGGANTLNTKELDSTESLTTYEYEHEADGYINSIFEITSGADGTRDPVGQIRTITASSRTNSGTSYYFALTTDVAFDENPAANDGYEMHAEVDDPHIDYLIYLMLEMAFISHNNTGGLSSIRNRLMAARKSFVDGITPRNNGAPAFWLDESLEIRRNDPDRDALLGLEVF